MLAVCSVPSCSGSEADGSVAVNTGVYLHAGQLYVSGLIQDDSTLQLSAQAVQREEQELAESLDSSEDEEDQWSSSSYESHSIDDEPNADDLPTASIQGAHPASGLLMNQGSELGKVRMPLSLLETGEEAWDGERALLTGENDLVVKEGQEKATAKKAKTEGRQEKERVLKAGLNSPGMKARQKAKAAVKETKREEKKKLEAFEKKEEAEIKTEIKVLKKKVLEDEELQAQDFSDTKDSEEFKQNATQLLADWDKANEPEPPPPEPDFVLTGSKKQGSTGNETELGDISTKKVKPVSWRVKIGMMKNFAPNPRAVTRTVASVSDMHALDVARIQSAGAVRDVGFVLHGHQLSRVDLKSGKIKHVAGSTPGFADGIGSAVKFDEPNDVAAFTDPLHPDQWMVLVADKKNDQLRLVRDPLGKGKTTVVLEKAMVEDPRRVAVVTSRQNTPDMISSSARKVFAFVICGKHTLVRVENILGRRKIKAEALAYESAWETKMRKRDAEIYNENGKATVHMISSKFMHLSDIAIAKEEADGGERIVAFLLDSKAGLVFRLDQIIEGERKAHITEVGNAPAKSGPMLAINSAGGASWFNIIGQPGKNQTLHRMDEVIEGKEEGQTGALFTLAQKGRLKGLAAMAKWGGHVYATVDTGKGSSELIDVDLSQDIVCKDKTLMGSSEFNELGELESLGLVQRVTKPLRLRSWVASSKVTGNETNWSVIAYHANQGRVCGVSTTVSTDGGVFGYFCQGGTCFPA